MSTLSQFLSMNPFEDTPSIGEIKVFPSINIGSTIIDSNNYIKVGSIVSKNDFPSLFNVIGYVEGSNYTRKNPGFIATVLANNRWYGLTTSGQVYDFPNTEARLISTGSSRSVNYGSNYFDSFYYSPQTNAFIICGTSGQLHTSTDAITWNTLTSSNTKLTSSISAVRYGDGLYVAVTSDRRMSTSTDLVNWESFPDTREVLQLAEVSFTSPGTYSWIVPPAVTSVNVVCIGGARASGGGLGWKNNIPVTPGSSITVVVGQAGNRQGSPNATESYFINNSTVAGGAASWSSGGGFVGDGGGFGGSQGGSSSRGGGGGAGGYVGNGGNGGSGNDNTTNSYFGAAGLGGGGGGGGGWNAGGGGGTGILGFGASGAGGNGTSDGSQNGGGGGSGGNNGTSYGTGGFGGLYGGGGANIDDWTTRGSSGAVRIVWGVGQSYPNNAAPQNVDANNMTSVTVSNNGLFVTGGVNGIIKTSSDGGETWTPRLSGTSSRINSLVFGNEIFVYAGENGILSTSTNGTTWTSRTSGTANTISTLAYSNGVFIYGTLNGSVGRSTDGTTWTLYSSVISSRIFSSAAIPNLYVVGGEASRIATSTNGITWTARSNVTANIIIGSTEYLEPGSYTWVAPSGVTSVSVVAVGGGAGTVYFNQINSGYQRRTGGGGGGLGWRNNISVTPGQSYSVNVGNGGTIVSSSGDEWSTNFLNTRGRNSDFISVNTVAGFGGGWNDWDATSTNRIIAAGGSYIGDNGGRGGRGSEAYNYGGDSSNQRFEISSGGAGGYNEVNGKSGGEGGLFYQSNSQPQWAQAMQPGVNTGAGAGGISGNRGGGGVGIWGKGRDGLTTWDGGGGSRGEPYFNTNDSQRGGRFGGGGSTWSGSGGGGAGNGAVRIIWGPNRVYSNIANVEIVGNIASSNIQTDDFLSMTYGNNLFVVGSRSNKIFTSTDAITWTGAFGANNQIANDILCITYSSDYYYYGDSNGNIALSNNLSNWISVSGNTLSHPINSISSIANTIIYVGNRGNIARIRNRNLGFYMIPSPIQIFGLEHCNVSNSFIVVGTYNLIYRSIGGVFSWSPVNVYDNNTGGQRPFNFSTNDSSNSFYRIFKTFEGSSIRFSAYGIGNSSNGRSLLYYSNNGANSQWNYTSNTTIWQTQEDRIREVQLSLTPQIIQEVPGYGIFMGSSYGIIRRGQYYYFSLDSGYNLSLVGGSIYCFGRTDDGKFFYSDGGIYATRNNSSTIEYSNFYNTTTQFYVPKVNVAFLTNFSSTNPTLPVTSDFFTTSNSVYENVYIRAK